MARQSAEVLEVIRAFNAEREERIRTSIVNRWSVTDWSSSFPWWREPPEVRILIYTDGDNRFEKLDHVTKLLEAQPYPHVKFTVTTAHREGNSGQLTAALLDSIDELWFFGINETPDLPLAEKELVETFMAAPKFGGVLVTGDHRNLGKALVGETKRVSAMRRWDIPEKGSNRLSSIVEGPDMDLTFTFEDEADDRPQTIHYRRFPLDAPDDVRLQPHPVLCSPDGPIDVLPDHPHEGEAIAPEDLTAWPQNDDGHRERPFVIAWGDVQDPQVHYRQFGLISAYNGHVVNVGRIVADSSWHHWVVGNIRGLEATEAGQAALKKIDAYFLNCASWLAPPQLQDQMRLTAWWSIVWADEIVEIPADASLPYFGERAIKELRRFASTCAVSEWVVGPETFNRALTNSQLAQISERVSLLNLRVEQFVAGGILRALMNAVGRFNPAVTFPTTAPPDADLERAINAGTLDALATIESEIQIEAMRVRTAVASLRPNKPN